MQFILYTELTCANVILITNICSFSRIDNILQTKGRRKGQDGWAGEKWIENAAGPWQSYRIWHSAMRYSTVCQWIPETELKHGMKEKGKEKKTQLRASVQCRPCLDYARKKLWFRLSFPVKYLHIFPAAVLGVMWPYRQASKLDNKKQ